MSLGRMEKIDMKKKYLQGDNVDISMFVVVIIDRGGNRESMYPKSLDFSNEFKVMISSIRLDACFFE